MLERLLAGLVVVPFLLGAAAAPADEAQVAFSFQDHDIVESSGLAVADGLVVTTNDSGDTGRVFAVDPATGETVGTTGWGNDAQDVEALAPLDDHEVWVGDIGDNLEQRDSIQVAPVPVGRGNADLDGPIYDLVYPDGAARRRDPDERPRHRPAVRRHEGGARRHAVRRARRPSTRPGPTGSSRWATCSRSRPTAPSSPTGSTW